MSVMMLAKKKPLFTPLLLPNLLGWWDASQITGKTDGASVTSFTDFSGNARHMTGTGTYKTAILNGKPVVRMNGTSNRYSLSYSAVSDFFVCAVMKKRAAATASDQAPIAFHTNAGTNQIDTNTGAPAGSAWFYYPDASFGVPTLGGTPTNAQILAFRVLTGLTFEYFINGALTPTGSFTPESNARDFQSFFLGSDASGSNQYADYDFGEVIITLSDPGASNIGMLFAYLRAKWAVS